MNQPNAILEKFTNISKCDICVYNYNRTDKQPVIICSMHHTICRECMKSLENKPECPFCRERIRFDKVVVNNYIYQLLPQEQIKPNTRVEVAQGSPAVSFPAQANRFVSNQPARSLNVNQNYRTGQNMNRQFSAPNLNGEFVRLNPPREVVPPPEPYSINNRPLQRVYEQEFHPLPEYQQEDAAHGSSQLTAYYCLFILQIPFTFFNFYFALTSPKSECMDKPHRLTILIVRPWLMTMGIIEVLLMGLFLLAFFLKYIRMITYQIFQKVKFVLGVLFVIKLLVWVFAQLQLFQASISKYCYGGMYAYGVVMTIIHGLFMLVLCCMVNSRTSRM